MAVYLWEEELLEVPEELGRTDYPPIKAIDFHTKVMSKYYGDDYRDTGSDSAGAGTGGSSVGAEINNTESRPSAEK
jgi:hypothetical protein